MSRRAQQTYYEIALTNRQVVGVFVVLLACLLVSFFAGVWVGRGAAAPATEPVALEPPPVSPDEDDEELLGEMEFFASEEAMEPPPRAAEPQAARPAPAPAEEAPAVPEAGEPYFIQVFSSADEEQAGRVRDRLRQAGYEAFLSAVEVEGLTMHRVRVGPYASEESAENAAETIRTRHRLDTWVTRRP